MRPEIGLPFVLRNFEGRSGRDLKGTLVSILNLKLQEAQEIIKCIEISQKNSQMSDLSQVFKANDIFI